MNIIANDGYTEKIKIYDLFCGPGIYKDGGEGSPFVLLRAINRLHEVNPAKNTSIPPIDVLFNDDEPTRIASLQQEIARENLYHPKFGELRIVSKKYLVILPEVISEINALKKEKAFVFIDPYGYSDIKGTDIKKLLASKKSEVLLFLPVQFMYRFGNKGTPQALIDFRNDIGLWQSSKNIGEFIDHLKDGFSKHLGNGFYVDTFTIRKDAVTVFCLFFFSSHIRGFEKMLDAKWKMDKEQGQGWSYEMQNTASLFMEQRNNPLAEKLRNFLKEAKTNVEIYEFTVKNGFLPTFANEILKNWKNSGILQVESARQEKIRRGAFYIDYKYYKLNDVICKIKVIN